MPNRVCEGCGVNVVQNAHAENCFKKRQAEALEEIKEILDAMLEEM